MKQVTSFLLLMLFLVSTAGFSQVAGSGLKKSELEKAKLARMFVKNEQAPGVTFGAVQYTDADYDLQFEYPCGDASGEAGAESDGNFIYTTKWNGAGFFKYGLDGTFLGAFQVGTVSAIRDLAYDGTYFYGGAATTTVYKMDFNTLTLVSTMVAGTATRAIAYDEVQDAFYSNNWSTPIVLWSRTGTVLATIPTVGDESYYGLAYDHQGPYLWGYSQKVGTSANMLYKLALPAGTVLESFDMLTILTLPTLGTDIAGGLYFQPDLIQGTNTLGGIVQNICIWGVEMGLTGPPPTIDVGVTAFVSPVSGPNLGNETVKITVKNFGANPASNIPVNYTLNGGAAVNGVLAGPIASGATADFTFPGTVNLSNPGQTYVFVGCTALAGDVNAGNNCKTHNVTHVIPTYCDASTTTEDEYISNVLCGSINNSSGWQGGVANYTNITTTINAGMSEAITVTNPVPYSSDMVTCWADWNKDFTFGTGDEQFVLTNVGGTGASFTGAIAVPAGTPDGEYRLRVRLTYSTAPTPCGSATYGEVEDYTIVVGGGGPTLNPPQNLAGMYVAPNSAVLTWDAPDEPGEWLSFCGPNDGGLGLEGGGSFFVAAHWTQAQVAPYVGFYLTKVSIFPTSTNNATYVLKIWTGVSGTTLVHNQPLNGLVFDEWNDIVLSTPLMIPSTDCWVGYQVTHNDGDNPAGLDAGPAVAGNGDMVSFDGTTWESMMNTYGLDYNFNIKAFVTEDADGQVAQPLPNKIAPVQNTNNQFVYAKRTSPAPAQSRATLTGYNVYRDEALIGSTGVAVLTYTDAGLAAGTYAYTVKAVYDGVNLSPAAGPVTVVIPPTGGPIIYEPFEDYTAGGYLAQQANAMGRNYWTTWSNAPGTAEDPFVSNAQASAGSKSVVIEGTNDCVLLFGDKTSGNYDINFHIYVANGFLGYFNLLHAFAGASSEWGLQVYFDEGGAGLVDAAGAGAATFTFGYDVWIPIKINVDLDNDWCKFYVNNSMVVEYQWSLGTFGTAGLNQLAAANFYAWVDVVQPKYYIDEVVFDEAGVTPNDPTIAVNPMTLNENHQNPGTITTKTVTVSNIGAGTLNWDLTVNTNPTSDAVNPPDSPEAIARLQAREAQDGIAPPSLGFDPLGSRVPAGYKPADLKNLRGEIAYGNNVEGNTFYSLDVETLAATVIGTTTYAAFCGDFAPGDMDNMYIIDYNDDVLKMVDISTGVATPIASVPCPMAPNGIWTELAIDKTTGIFYATATDIAVSNLYEIDPNSGAITLIGNCGIAAIISCTIDLSGTMYAFDIVSDNTYTVDLATGVGTLLGPAGFNGNYAQGMGYDPVNDKVYLAAYSTFAELRELNTTTGATTALGALPGETGAFGFPYQGGTQPGTDVGVTAFVSPVSGPYLGNETVTIKVKNFGTNSASNIPVSYTLDGGAAVTGTLAGPIASGATADFTFPGTVNLGNPGQTYVFVGCTALAGDENPNNNCKTANVTNVIPTYCTATTQVEDEYIANVLCGTINNTSGWQGGVADYTAMSTTIDAGASEDITITNGNAWASDIVYCWADWNKDFTFGTGDEQFMLTNVGGTGQTFTGAIAVPAGTPGGDYRLRIRMTYSTAPVPCGDATYGEVEDYTIHVGGAPPTAWLSANLLSGSLTGGQSSNITVTFNSTGLQNGTYTGSLVFASNDPANPSVTVPVTLVIGGPPPVPVIVVNPMSLVQQVAPNGTAQNLVNIANTGGSNLTYDITIEYVTDKSASQGEIVPDSPEAIAALNARMEADGITLNGSESVRGLTFGPVKYTDDDYDLQFEYPCGDASGEAGAESDGNFIYTTKWNGSGFFKYGLDGTFLGAFQVGTVNAIRDLAFDGTYMYGGAAATTVYQMDFTTNTLVSTMTAGTATRAIAYDEGEDGFWSNNWSTPITLWDRSGAVLNTIATAGDESYYGFAYDPQGPYLWGYSQRIGTSANMLYKMDLPGGTLVEEFDMLTILTLPILGTDIAGGLYFQPDIIQGTNTLGGIVQNICIWGIEMGLTGPPPTTDVGVQAFVSPVSGPNLGNETVTIKVKNFGTNSVSNIPVSYTLDGGAAVTGTLAGPIASGATADFTFPGTVNLGNPGQTYVFVGCTALSGDLNPGNDCKTSNVTNVLPQYCDATTQVEDEWIANVLCGDINNPSGWQGGVANYTNISTQIDAGASEAITIENGNAWASDIVYCWADWNMDYTFGTGDEQFMLTNVGGTGQTFTGAIAVPAGTPNGEYRLRIRMTYSTAPVPCGDATYGEVEDYTIVVGGGGPNWLSVTPTTGSVGAGQNTNITLNFDAAGLANGQYGAKLHIANNSATSPVDVDVTMLVGSMDWYVNPSALAEVHNNPPQITTKTVTVTNNSANALNWTLVVNRGSDGITEPDSPEAIALLAEREAQDGINVHSLGVDPLGSRVPAGYKPADLKNLRGEIAYGNNVEGNTFYSLDVATLAATVIGSTTYAAFCGDFAPGDMDNMYVIDYNDDVLKMVDISTGVATPIASVPCPMAPNGIWTELAIDKTTGIFYATATDIAVSNLYEIDPNSGAITLIGNCGIAAIISCTIDLSGTMYAFDIVSDNTYTVDLATGVGTLLGPAGFNGNYAQGMGYDAVNDKIYLAAYSTFAELRELNTTTGATTALGALPGETGAFGFPYQGGPQPGVDVGVTAFVSPVSGPYLGNETVTIKVKNFGTNSASNIPVSYTLDGGAAVTGTLAGPIASGATADFTFPGTVNLGNPGQTYVFVGCTALAGDENSGNNCKTANVTNVIPTYCDATTQVEDEYIANVLCGDINNTSGWQGGVADYTAMSTTIDAGASEDITITNGNAWASDIVYCWADWNKDFTFGTGDEQFMLTNVGGTGQTFTGAIAVPAGTPGGDYRLRIRMTYSTAPVPCGDATYGEVEDYTINVGGVGPTAWLSADPLSGTILPNATATVTVTFNSTTLAPGTYTGSLVFSAPANPASITVPVTLTVSPTGGAVIAVNPASFYFTQLPGVVDTETMTISNTGTATLNCALSITYDNQMPVFTSFDVEAYRSNPGTGYMNAESTPESIPSGNVINTTDAMWDLQFSAPAGDASGEAGIETDGNFIYTTKWNGSGFFKYEMDGTFIGAMTVGSVNGIRDLAFDGTYMYGGAAATTVYKMDFSNQTLIGQFTAPTAVRAIAYDYDEDGFYANNWSTPIVLFDASGATLNTLPTAGDESYYGFAYDNNNGSKHLYGFSQKVGLSGGVIFELALPGGTPTGVSHDVVTELATPGTDLAGGLFTCDNWFVNGTTSIGGLVQNIVLFAYELNDAQGPVEWLSVSANQVNVNAGGSANVTVTCNTGDLPDNIFYYASIWIANNSTNNQLVEVPVTLELIVGIDDASGDSYIMMYPNPTSDFVNIKTNSNISQVRIFNQAGQLVLNENVNGSEIRVETNTLNTGTYFVEITSGAGVVTSKLIVK